MVISNLNHYIPYNLLASDRGLLWEYSKRWNNIAAVLTKLESLIVSQLTRANCELVYSEAKSSLGHFLKR